MALTTHSGVVSLQANDTITDALDVATLVITNNSGSPIDVIVREGDASTVIMTVTVPANDSVVMPFGGSPRGKHFPSGLNTATSGAQLIAFLS